MKIFHEVRHYNDNFHVWHSGYRNMSFLAHWHNEMEFIFVKEGAARITVDGNDYSVKKGDLLIVGSHSLHFNDAYKLENYLEFILFDPDLIIPKDLVWHKNLYFPSETLKKIGLDSVVLQVFNNVSFELNNNQSHYKSIVTSNILILWYSLLRFVPESDDNSTKSGIKKMEKSLTYIKKHYCEQITLSDVAEHAELSPSYFSGLFHQFIGISFVQYLQLIRIDEAIRMLQNSKRKIIDVALDTGFTNIRSFNRVFRELTGTSPSAFIKNHPNDIMHVSIAYNVGDDSKVENDSFVVIENIQPLTDK